MKKVFVTGGSGYVGRNLIRHLKAHGAEVRALVRTEAAAQAVRALGAIPVLGDLSDVTVMQQGMQACEVVFHAAAKVSEWGPRAAFDQVNVLGTQHVLEAARTAHVPRLVHVSTEAVLVGGKPLINVDESLPRPERSLPRYPESKAQAEELVLAANGANLHTIIVRPRFIWGGDDTTLLPQIVKAVKDGRFLWINGGHYLISTTHVDNVCEGLLLAAERGRPGEIYFVTDGTPIEFRAFLTDLLATQGVDPGKRSLPKALALSVATVGEAIWDALNVKSPPPITRAMVRLIGEEVTINDSKARRELGYRGHVTREAGLEALHQPAVRRAA